MVEEKIIEKFDYIEIDYIAKVEGKVVDTTLKEVAEKEKLDIKNLEPIAIIAGENMVVKGLDEALLGKKEGDHFSIKIPPEKAFGHPDPNRILLIPLKYFKQSKIEPVPGLVVNIDGMIGVVKSVSGGRVLVDFNHPLAGKEIEYEVWVRKVVKDKEEKIKLILEKIFRLNKDDYEVKYDKEKDELEIILKKQFPSNLTRSLADLLKKWVSLKTVKISYLF